MSGPEVTQPKQFGSHRSRLVLTLLEDEVHRKEVSLSRDEWETLVTWVDANAPYHSTYFRYFDSRGKLLPNAIRVRVELDPPFKAGEKTYRIVGLSHRSACSQIIRPMSKSPESAGFVAPKARYLGRPWLSRLR
jgi:hypothetical protein